MSWVWRKTVVRESWDHRELSGSVGGGCFSREQVVWCACDCRKTVAQQSWVTRGTLARPSPDYITQDCRRTDSRQPQDIDTTKNRRAKKVHVQFCLTTASRCHDAQNFVGLSCDDPRWPTICPNFLSCRGTNASWVRCDHGLRKDSL